MQVLHDHATYERALLETEQWRVGSSPGTNTRWNKTAEASIRGLVLTTNGTRLSVTEDPQYKAQHGPFKNTLSHCVTRSTQPVITKVISLGWAPHSPMPIQGDHPPHSLGVPLTEHSQGKTLSEHLLKTYLRHWVATKLVVHYPSLLMPLQVPPLT